MIETLALTLALTCGATEPPIPMPFVQAMLGSYRQVDHLSDIVFPVGHPLASVFGSQRPDLPTEPVEEFSESLSYAVWVDPIYDYDCFSEFVDDTLLDERSWPGLRRAADNETPQFWVTLTAPAGACGSYKNPRATCAWNNRDGTGIVTINAMRWVRGHGHDGDRSRLLNHEVGHILGFGHYHASLMGHYPWTAAAGLPRYTSEWTDPGVYVWPSDAERKMAEFVYTERWLRGGGGPWSGREFVDAYLDLGEG